MLKGVLACAAGMAFPPGVRPGYAGDGQVIIPPEFADELRRGQLVFNVDALKGFVTARVLQNPHFHYSFAVRHSTVPFEARYATRQVTVHAKLGVEESLHQWVWISVANMSRKTKEGPVMSEPEFFHRTAVREEFGADLGTHSIFEPVPTFAKYTRGLVNTIYLAKRQTLGYCIFLYNQVPDKGISAEADNAMSQIFHAMRFKT
jgi:hypothetical protein